MGSSKIFKHAKDRWSSRQRHPRIPESWPETQGALAALRDRRHAPSWDTIKTLVDQTRTGTPAGSVNRRWRVWAEMMPGTFEASLAKDGVAFDFTDTIRDARFRPPWFPPGDANRRPLAITVRQCSSMPL